MTLLSMKLRRAESDERMKMTTRLATLFLLLLAYGSTAWSQTGAPAREFPVKAVPQIDFRATRLHYSFLSNFRAPLTGGSRTQNSETLGRLIHGGKLALTLQDAITLAIENNFDVELQRYNRAFASTEILRAKGGGQLRGVPTTIAELPAGEGGPGEPLLTTVGGYSPVLQLPSSSADLATITETQSDLTILSPTPYSSGSPIPPFDPSVNVKVALAQTVLPQATDFSTGSNYYSSHSLYGSVRYNQGFSTGTILDTSFSSDRSNEASTRLNLDPFTTGALNLTITQPLLRGFGIRVNRRFIDIAKEESEVSDEVFMQQLIATISDVTRLYWDLVSLQQDMQVKQEALTAAERLYTDTRNEVELGTQAPVDLTSALAQVASNRQALINAHGMVLQQELLLKEVLTRRGISDQEVANSSIEALTQIPTPSSDENEPLDALVNEAMRQRPDLILAEKQREISRNALKGSRNEVLPELNIVVSMQNNGGAGQSNPDLALSGNTSSAPPANLIGGYSQVLDQIFRRDFPDYSVGIRLNLPIHNKVARADAARDELQYRQSQVRMEQLRSQVRLQVGNAYIALQQAKESYEAAVEARALQEQAFDVQKAKFESGVATAYELLQYQSSLAEARSAEVTALGVYGKAKDSLQRATGSTLTVNHISVGDGRMR